MNPSRELKTFRRAFLWFLEREQPQEIPTQGKDNPDRWIYRQPEPDDQYLHKLRPLTKTQTHERSTPVPIQ